MKVVALQRHTIPSTVRLEHHGPNTMNSDSTSTGSAQEKCQSWNETYTQSKFSAEGKKIWEMIAADF